jgi:hypothetical protein
MNMKTDDGLRLLICDTCGRMDRCGSEEIKKWFDYGRCDPGNLAGGSVYQPAYGSLI